MKKLLYIIIILFSANMVNAQARDTFAIMLNDNGTKTVFYVYQFQYGIRDGNGNYVAPRLDSMKEAGKSFVWPTSVDKFKQNAKGIWENYPDKAEWIGLTGIPAAVTNLSGTNTGDNATNSQYAGLAASKQDALGFTPVPNTRTVNGQALSSNITILGNVDNTSDANKPISTATQTALNNKTTYYTGTDAGANDSYVVTLSPVPPSLTTGMIVIFRANTANTTGCTINVNGLGVTTIVKRVSTTPATGDILALMWCMLVYNGTNFVILNPVVN